MFPASANCKNPKARYDYTSKLRTRKDAPATDVNEVSF